MKNVEEIEKLRTDARKSIQEAKEDYATLVKRKMAEIIELCQVGEFPCILMWSFEGHDGLALGGSKQDLANLFAGLIIGGNCENLREVIDAAFETIKKNQNPKP